MRYIHQNPIKIGEVEKIATYQWSSYLEYFGGDNLVDIDFALAFFSPDTEIAIQRFEKFMKESVEELGIMVYPPGKLADQVAKLAIQKTAGIAIPAELQTMEKKKRNEIIRQIKQIDGITTRQIARLTGITQSVIVRV